MQNLMSLVDPTGASAYLDVQGLLERAESDIANGRVITPFAGSRRRTAEETRGRTVMVAAADSSAMGGGRSCSQGLMPELLEHARHCKPWGKEPPAGCTDRNGYIRPEMVCGSILPYRFTVPLSSAGNTYNWTARKWAQPLFWIDASESTDITITNLQYQDNPVYGTTNVAITPLSVFGASDAQRFVPGLPAIGNDNGDALVFTLANVNVADQEFAGIMLGVAAKV